MESRLKTRFILLCKMWHRPFDVLVQKVLGSEEDVPEDDAPVLGGNSGR
jgi:hypothetical protein